MDRFLVKHPDSGTTNNAAPPAKKLKTSTTSKSETKIDTGTSAPEKSSARNEKEGFRIKKMKGDLFKCPPHHSLAHCISEDVRMGKGIATLFKSKFGGVDDLKKQGVKTGGVAVLKRQSRFIYYLITKDKYWQKPTYVSLRSTLQAMSNHCREHKVNYVSMPLIGCGLDGLKWTEVENIIKDVFKDDNITVTVYTL